MPLFIFFKDIKKNWLGNGSCLTQNKTSKLQYPTCSLLGDRHESILPQNPIVNCLIYTNLPYLTYFYQQIVNVDYSQYMELLKNSYNDEYYCSFFCVIDFLYSVALNKTLYEEIYNYRSNIGTEYLVLFLLENK